MKSKSKFIHFHSIGYFGKCRLGNVGHFVSASICWNEILWLQRNKNDNTISIAHRIHYMGRNMYDLRSRPGGNIILAGLMSLCVPWSTNILCSPTLTIQASGSSVKKSTQMDLKHRKRKWMKHRKRKWMKHSKRKRMKHRKRKWTSVHVKKTLGLAWVRYRLDRSTQLSTISAHLCVKYKRSICIYL